MISLSWKGLLSLTYNHSHGSAQLPLTLNTSLLLWLFAIGCFYDQISTSFQTVTIWDFHEWLLRLPRGGADPKGLCFKRINIYNVSIQFSMSQLGSFAPASGVNSNKKKSQKKSFSALLHHHQTLSISFPLITKAKHIHNSTLAFPFNKYLLSTYDEQFTILLGMQRQNNAKRLLSRTFLVW